MKGPFSLPAKGAARSAWAHWLFAYLTLLAIPMVLSFLIYTQALRVLDAQMKKLTYASLKQTQTAIDGELQKATAPAGQYLVDERLQAAMLARPGDPQTATTWQAAIRVMSEGLIHPIISNIGVYLPHSDQMLTNGGSASLETYARVYVKNLPSPKDSGLVSDADIEALRRMLLARQPGRFVCACDDAVLYLFSSPIKRQNASIGTLSLLISRERIVNLLSRTEWLADGKITARDPSGLWTAHAENGSADSVAHVQEILSAETGWTYSLSTPQTVYDTFVQMAMRASTIGFVLSALLGIGAAFFFTRRMGMPILHIFNKLSRDAGIDRDAGKQSIYQAMDGAINALVAAKRDQSETNARNLCAYRERMLLAVLDGYRCSPGFLRDLCELFSIPTEGSAYVIARFLGVAPLPPLPDAIEGVLLSDDHHGTTLIAFSRGGQMAPEGTQRAVYAYAAECVRLHAHLCCAVSTALLRVDDLPGAGAVAQKTALRLAQGELMLCPVAEDEPADAAFPFEFPPQATTDALIHRLRARDLPGATQVICAWVERDGGQSEAAAGWDSAVMTRIAMQEMLSWIDRASLERENILPQLFLCDSRKEACMQISRFMMRMEAHMKSGRDMDVAMRAIAYIEREYADADMSLEGIAQALDVSASSLTRKFKANVGMTVLEFIHATRIAHAKALLSLPLGERPTISETAQRVGFLSVNTFIRIFKRCTGTTPGQF